MNKEIDTVKVIEQLAQQSLDFHCHGVGKFDFTEIPELDLQEIENILAKRKQRTVLTLYLPKPNFNDFLQLIDKFHIGKKNGQYNYITGFAIEGPLLASHGGTPEEGVWMPTKREWIQLAQCGKKGLLYMVISPDAKFSKSANNNNLDTPPPNIIWIAENLLKYGVLPAPGHFTKNDPAASAKALQSIFDVVAHWGYSPTITDHLFNDMPHNFKHAWRTPEERAKRDEEIKQLHLENWSIDTLDEAIGFVPAVMIRNARQGRVKICQNFDGEHVDLAVVKKAVELIGAENMIMMTDSIESKRLAKRELHMIKGSTLLYQDEGIVAAGSQTTSHQIKNMLSIGLSIKQIEMITNFVPSNIVNLHNEYTQTQTHCI